MTWRDLEFMWDASYPGGLNIDARNTLDRMASTLVDSTGWNPFGAELSKIRLAYNYFRFADTAGVGGPTYNPLDALDSTAMSIARYTDGYTNADKSHVDQYLARDGASQWPSFYAEAAEDSTTGHAVNLTNPAVTDVKGYNSISNSGPGTGFHIDLDGDGWTHPDSVGAIGFVHEFQHSFNRTYTLGFMMDEMFSQATEAILGPLGKNTEFEVPYTWPLFYQNRIGCTSSGGDCCQNPRDAFASNYFARGLFTAYLAYNFRGADTTGSAAGLNDDLLRRWSRNTVSLASEDQADRLTRHWGGLVALLGDDSCGSCVGRNFFRQGGSALPSYDRAQLLLHNWRVANYVNRSDLPGTEGQYGFPPHFGFSPGGTLKAWQAFDGCGPSDDLVAVPPVVTLTSAHVSQEMILRVKREFRGNWHPLRLKPTGAEYWVIRADTASLGTTPRDLVITVSTDSIFRSRQAGQQYDGRLIASVVAYTLRAPDEVESPQWANPQWAQLALEPRWADVDSLPAELVFTVPSFGLTYKAAVVVITLADGPSRALENTNLGWQGVGSSFQLPYRMGLALRGAPNDTLPNPRSLHEDGSLVADAPTWSPPSDEVAFTRSVPQTGESRIYRRRLDGSPAAPLASGTEPQSHPDWSPRGDWIALSQPPAGGPSGDRHLWLYSPTGSPAPQELTSGSTVTDRWPAFQPNGQAVAYARLYWYFDGSTYAEHWQLRRLNLDGTGDVALVYPGTAVEIRSVRWTPDGGTVYFTRNDSLYAISRDGGALVHHPEILPKVTSFDFHPSGTNRLVAEQIGNAGSLANPQFSPVAFRRLALRDVAATDTRGRFYRTGAEFYSPRWSPDGIRVAYGSNQNTATDRDLFVGQISYNLPPQILTASDQVAYPGQTFQMMIAATDPNGELLTYDMPAIYLPTGASFNPGTATFSWPNPGPQGATHYVVARALDGSGGVASRVHKLSVTLNAVSDLNSELISDTEVWLNWTAPGQGSFQGVQYDLRYATFAINEANFELASIASAPAPGSPGSYQETTVSGLSPCTQYGFAIRTKDPNGNWSAIGNAFSATTPCGGGGGGGLRAAERGPTLARSIPSGSGGSALVVAMDLVRDGPVWIVRQLDAEAAAALGANDSVAVCFQLQDGDGHWTERSRIMKRDAPWRFAIRAFRRPGRIVFFGPYQARQSWSPVEMDRSDAVAALISARHSRLGDVAGGFEGSGTATLDVSTGDTLVLTYEPVPTEAPAGSDWFLLVGPPGSEVSTPAFATPQGTEAERRLPTAIALRQNQPNPFSGTTTIRFDLPAEATVRLEIFDAQGRLVRTLANGQFPAGFHAVEWDHRADQGQALGAGVYLYRIQAGAFRDQKKMVLLAR